MYITSYTGVKEPRTALAAGLHEGGGYQKKKDTFAYDVIGAPCYAAGCLASLLPLKTNRFEVTRIPSVTIVNKSATFCQKS